MSYELVIAILAGLGGMLGWGLADFFAKKTIDQIGDTLTLAWGHIFGTIILIFAAIYGWQSGRINLPALNDGSTWLGVAFFGVLQAAVYFFVYKGFGKGQVTLLAPIFASFSGLTAALSIIFFNEAVSGMIILVLAMIFVGVLLVSLSLDSFKTRRLDFSHIPGIREVGLATLMAAFWTLFWDRFVGGQDWLLYTMLMYFFMTLAILLYVWVTKLAMLTVPKGMWKYLVLIGAGETVAYLAISIGYSLTTLTSVVALLSGAFSVPTLILAYIFLEERVTRTQIIGCLVIIVGIVSLSLV
jgi:drug/metabolite transporter (DMT)-like permease